MPRGSGTLDAQLKSLPGHGANSKSSPKTPGIPAASVTSGATSPVYDPQIHEKTLQQVCREEIENLHGIFVCWFKGLQPREELERELMDRITPNFSHVAPNGQFLKGRANLMQNLYEKYQAYPIKAFDIQIENVKVIWTLQDLCLVTYEEWQWWREVDANTGAGDNMATANATPDSAHTAASSDDTNGEDVVRFGRLSSCLLKQRPGNFQWIHVHETWLEGVGPNEKLNIYGDNDSESSGSYDVQVTYKNQQTPTKVDDNGDHQVRFSNQREEVSYAFKKHGKNNDRQSQIHAQTAEVAMAATSANASHVPQQVQAPSNASRRRHISPQLTDFAKACMVNNELIGISIAGWDIGTGQGPMGDEAWFSAASTNFELVSQPRSSSASSPQTPKLKRRINLPEMVFPAAHVAFEHRQDNLWISWDVLDALDDWAKAHRKIPVNSDTEHMGVSVLKSGDAELWASKKKNVIPDNSNNNSGKGQKAKDVFHFDWTYSTPFSGSVEGGYWKEIPNSGLKLDMLKDKSVPILFFDELVLFEDDLHDNGHVQYSLKIRVMPTCAFVLARLWVRIDRVLLRLRETRVLFEFGKAPSDATSIYRDITWRECFWQDLPAYNLPTNLKLWCSEGPETPQLAILMSKLPEIQPPHGVPKHSVLKRGPKPKKK